MVWSQFKLVFGVNFINIKRKKMSRNVTKAKNIQAKSSEHTSKIDSVPLSQIDSPKNWPSVLRWRHCLNNWPGRHRKLLLLSYLITLLLKRKRYEQNLGHNAIYIHYHKQYEHYLILFNLKLKICMKKFFLTRIK